MVKTISTDAGAGFKVQRLPTYVGVQYLRAFAAIAVVVFHCAQRYGVDFARGARGVDVFFVISGFIMWTLANSRPVTPGGFLLDRIKRIVPLYWLATAAIIVAGFVGAVANTKNDLSIPSVLQSLFFVPYRAEGATEIWPILPPGWTLNYEMFFYAIFAGFLFADKRIRLWGLTITFAGLILAGAICKPQDAILSTYTNPLLGHFLAGVWIAEAIRKGITLPPAAAMPAVIAGFLALYLIPFGDVFTVLACGLASAAVVAGIVSMDQRHSVRKIGALLLAGNASYSIYLWHGFALSIVSKIASPLHLPVWLSIPAGVIAGIVTGLVAYRFIEEPIRRALSSSARRRAMSDAEGVRSGTA